MTDELHSAPTVRPVAGPGDPTAPGLAHSPEAMDVQFSWSGRRIGPYRVERLLGRGGMGTVLLARRDDAHFQQHVALKVLRLESSSPETLARFRNERQILAALQHPNIATLLDGGQTPEGQPYLVMEHVDGEPLTAFCEERRLSAAERLRLFLQVCAAVQYAHQQLVVHRDLKPANILVTRAGVPKLLDFGIAKLLAAAELGAAPLETQTGMYLMTPGYASPEQIRAEPVTTATDVYSLGVVLYELLTGRLPRQLERHSVAEMMRLVAETDPPPPSSHGLPALRGDLDTIVLRAMHRDPGRRYASVEQLAADVRRHLERRPVLARPDTVGYRLSRFASRNRWGVAAGTAVALSMAAGTAVSVWQARVAGERFLQVRKLAGRFIELHDEVARLPGSTRIREQMVATALDYLANLESHRSDDPELLAEIGLAYDRVAKAQGAPGGPSLGRAPDALRSYQHAIEALSAAAALDPGHRVELARVQSEFAYLALLSGHRSEAHASLGAARSLLADLRRERPGDPQLLRLASTVATTQGDLVEQEGHADLRLAFYREAYDDASGFAGLSPGKDAQARLHLAGTLLAQALGDSLHQAEAIALLRRNDTLIDGLLAQEPDNPTYLRQKMASANYEGTILDSDSDRSLGQPAEAVAAFRRYADLARRLRDGDPDNASARLSLAIAQYRLAFPLSKLDPSAAVRSAREALTILDGELERSPDGRLLRSRRARALRHLGHALRAAHRLTEARAAVDEAIAIEEALLHEVAGDASERAELELARALRGQL
jgi:tetratricopeptide (TPR) repeat protein